MAPDELDAAAWWLVLGVSIPLGAACAAAALLAAGRMGLLPRTVRPGPALLVGAAGLVGTAITLLAGWDRMGLGWVGVDGRVVRAALGSFARTGTPLVLGTAAGAAAAGSLLARRGGRVSVIAAPAAVLVATAGALLVARNSSLENLQGSHPRGTLTGTTDPATRIVGDLAFVTSVTTAPGGGLLFAEMTTGRVFVLESDAPEPRLITKVPLDTGARLFHVEPVPGRSDLASLLVTREYAAGDDFLGEFLIVPTVPGGPATGAAPLRGYRTRPDHPASAIAACDGYIYVSVGDGDPAGFTRDGSPRYEAQQLTSPQGKVLRYAMDGTALSPAGVVPGDLPVFALGFRNLFGLACGVEPGTLLGADNGYVGRDQVRVIESGSNHEWPFSEGRDGFVRPLWDSGATPIAPTGITVLRSGPAPRIFITAFHSNSLYELVSGAGGDDSRLRLVHRFPGPVLSVAAGTDGCLYVGDADSLWRVDVTGCTP